MPGKTGLHYNTFRYYDPAGACYTQKDPIGLAGGYNTYTYAPEPLNWIDPLGLATRPNNGEYHSFFEHTVDPKNYFSSDAVQFNRANKAFINEMNTNMSFREDMLSRYPKLSNWLQNPNMGASPVDLTWHHHEEIGRLTLVDRLDHANNHALYHPTGKGGRDIWGGGELGRRDKLDGATGKPKGVKCV